MTSMIILPQPADCPVRRTGCSDVVLFFDGRLRLGVEVAGLGRFDGLEIAVAAAAAAGAERQIELMRQLWAGGTVVAHEDRDHRIDRAGCAEAEAANSHLVGVPAEAAYDRAARISDGVLFGARTQTEAARSG